MPITLLRVDERLIHGQVVVGWGERYHVDRIVVVDDELRRSEWEQELYCLGVPPNVDAAFVDDSRVYHGVTAVVPINPDRPAYRDVLVVTFRRE